MDAVELDIHRKNTTAFIAVKPSVIALVPQDKVRKPAGGYAIVQRDPRAAQTFRIIELGTVQTPQVLNLTDGKQREAQFWLLGEFSAQMATGDFWLSEDGRSWEIGDIVRENGYEQRGIVAERG